MLGPLGKSLAQLDAHGMPVLATADAGVLPYYSQWRTIDIFGLNERAIGRSGRHDPTYILSQKPDLVFLNSSAPDSFVARMPWVQSLYDASRGYGLAPVLVIHVRFAEYYTWALGSPQNPIVHRWRTGLSGM